MNIIISVFNKDIIKLLPFFLFFIILTFYVSGNIFFWDTVQLGAKHGLFFYENNFSHILLPDSMDSGHIPGFGAYLALVWKIFGKSLFVSHLAMLPFLLGIVWQAYVLIEQYINQKYAYYALILFLADPTFLGQAVLVSPDIPLIFFTLLSLNCILKKKRLLLMPGLIGLILTSNRGVMIISALFIIDLFKDFRINSLKKIILKALQYLKYYLPALTIFIGYNLYHYSVKGWIGYHSGSPWAPSFQIVDLMGFFYNSGILIWRLIDFGRVFLWIIVLVILFKNYKNIIKDHKAIQIFMIFIMFLLNLSVSFVSYNGLQQHRYLLPVYLAFSLFAGYLVFEKIRIEKWKYITFAILLTGLLAGNLWIYPEQVSQGWDASLAHLPYYELRHKMLRYIEEENIKFEQIGCVFPNLAEQKYLELNEDNRKHIRKNLDTNPYVLYSNVYNSFTDQEIDRLKKKFIPVKEYRKCRVFMRLYKNPGIPEVEN